MNVDKAELKMQLAQSWGKRFELMGEAAKKALHELEGGVAALKKAAEALDKHRAYYQEAVDAGELTVDECKLVMAVIDRCVGGLQNLVDQAQVATLVKQGEISGITKSGDVLEKEYHAEREKLEKLASAIESGVITPENLRGPSLRVMPSDDTRSQTAAAADIQKRREAARKDKPQAAAAPTPDAEEEVKAPPVKVEKAQKAQKRKAKRRTIAG